MHLPHLSCRPSKYKWHFHLLTGLSLALNTRTSGPRPPPSLTREATSLLQPATAYRHLSKTPNLAGAFRVDPSHHPRPSCVHAAPPSSTPPPPPPWVPHCHTCHSHSPPNHGLPRTFTTRTSHLRDSLCSTCMRNFSCAPRRAHSWTVSLSRTMTKTRKTSGSYPSNPQSGASTSTSTTTTTTVPTTTTTTTRARRSISNCAVQCNCNNVSNNNSNNAAATSAAAQPRSQSQSPLGHIGVEAALATSETGQGQG